MATVDDGGEVRLFVVDDVLRAGVEVVGVEEDDEKSFFSSDDSFA